MNAQRDTSELASIQKELCEIEVASHALSKRRYSLEVKYERLRMATLNKRAMTPLRAINVDYLDEE